MFANILSAGICWYQQKGIEKYCSFFEKREGQFGWDKFHAGSRNRRSCVLLLEEDWEVVQSKEKD